MALQDLSGGNYGAVVSISATGMAAPKRDVSNNVLTALLELVSLADQTGAAIGVAGNPLVVTTSGGVTGTPLGYQQSTATGALFTPTVPLGSVVAIVSVEGNDARWRDDGTSPTASVGMPVFAGQQYTFSGDLTNLQFIAQANTSTFNISYYS